MTVRQATEHDAPGIFELGTAYNAFHVSERVPFYEYDEVVAWLRDPKDNIFLVAQVESTIVGFLFCKVMSIHWALLDNFYVIPKSRGEALGAALLRELRSLLRQRNVKYLSSLIESRDDLSQRYAKQVGFKPQQQYQWIDTFLDDKDFLTDGE